MFSLRSLIIELLDNFLKILKAFSGCGERFHEIAIRENGGGKERKMIGGLATASQVRDGGIRLKQKLWGMESTKKIFYQAISPKTVGPDIHDFRKSCIHTQERMSNLNFTL